MSTRNSEELIRIGVDLDNTIAKDVFDPANPNDDIGDPIWENVAKLKEVYQHGYKIHIFTSRPDWQVERIEEWLETNGIPYSFVRCGKPLYRLLIDDRTRHPDAATWMP